MRVVALVSGGKNSTYNMMKCLEAGHEIVALVNIKPEQGEELNSYMYKTVGNEAIPLYAEAMGLSLYQDTLKGKFVNKDLNYQVCEGDEVEDLYQLLRRVKQEIVGGVEGVTSGILFHDYRKSRLENVCARLGLVSLMCLWGIDDYKVVCDTIKDGVDSVIIRVGQTGLFPDFYLGKTLKDKLPSIEAAADRWEFSIGGDRDEYETFTLDCPIFKKKIVIEESEVVEHQRGFTPKASLRLTKLKLEDKGHQHNNMPQSSSDVSKPKEQVAQTGE